MRTLVENKVLAILNEMADDDMESVESALDLDMGFWNADEGPAMSKEVYTDIIKKLDNDELLSLYEYLVYAG